VNAHLKPDIRIEQEVFSEALAAEMLPLGQACWDESTLVKKRSCAFYGERDFSVDPDMERYGALAKAGLMVVVTLRNGALKGYLLGFACRSLHSKKIICGSVDSIYVDPEYRAYTAVLAEKFEQEVVGRRGAEIISWSTHIDGPIYQILKARGYVGDDVTMEKRFVRGG
jgi:hypothetical protein